MKKRSIRKLFSLPHLFNILYQTVKTIQAIIHKTKGKCNTFPVHMDAFSRTYHHRLIQASVRVRGPSLGLSRQSTHVLVQTSAPSRLV